MNSEKKINGNSVRELYRGVEVFVTGASGFVGKVLVEKLLRSCPEIKKVYVLLRPKKNLNLKERIDEMTSGMLFERIKSENSSVLTKIHGIEGDAKKLRLGISDDDLEKLKSCTVIFHLAACVRFDDQLSAALKLNTRGTREICELARDLPQLKAFVYVSTAYVQPKNLHIQEDLYPVTCDWKYYIKYAENVDEDDLNAVTEQLTSFAPNTYSFTKYLAEHVANDYRREFNLPIIIYRPSIVSVTDSELAGYCDTLSGPNGVLFASMAGIKRAHTAKVQVLDIIPVDICVKGMILASAKDQKSDEMPTEAPVYNAASIRTISIQQLQEAAKSLMENNPLENSIGLPSIIFTKYKLCLIFFTIYLQILPALLIDGLLILFCKKPKLMKYQRIVANVENSLIFFTSNIFHFETDKFSELSRNVCIEDQKEFNMKPVLDLFEYFRQGYLVTKKIILKEFEENEIAAKKKRPYFKALAMMFKLFNYALCYKGLVYLYGIFIKS